MNRRSHFLMAIAAFSCAYGWLRAQEAPSADRELTALEARLQEQRAVAVRARLALYVDELEKLHSQFTAAGESAGADAVRKELDLANLSIKRLGAIARGQLEPPSADEAKEGGPLASTALATRRIDGILQRFSNLSGNGVSPALRNQPALQIRPRLLKIEKASLKGGNGSGGDYWAYESSYALWSVDDLAPGEYEIILRYAGGARSGGKATVKAAGQKFDVTVPKGEKGQGQKKQEIKAGVVKVKEPGIDIRVDSGGLASGADRLWDLQAVILQPATKSP